MKFCALYVRGKYLYLFPQCKATSGYYIVQAPVTKIEADVSPRELGSHIFKTFEHYRENVPLPEDLKTLVRPLYEAAGVKSWRTFSKDAFPMNLLWTNNEIEISVLQRAPGGFVGNVDDIYYCEPKEEKIGQKILDLIKIYR